MSIILIDYNIIVGDNLWGVISLGAIYGEDNLHGVSVI